MAAPQPTANDVPPSPFKSILNFRDVAQTINDLPSPKSRPRLKPGLLYRSARPDEASASDRQALTEKYRIKTILDLRSKTEHIEAAKKLDARRCESLGPDVDLTTRSASAVPAARSSDTIKISGIKYEEINLNGGSFSRALLWKLSWLSLSKLIGLMALGYRVEAIGILGREVMAPRGLIGLGEDSLEFSTGEIFSCFKILADSDSYPILIHCTQGKDRTGLIVLLTLLLLDVPVDAINADYTASERELEVERASRMKEITSIGLGEDFAGCPEGFVGAMKAYIDAKWGGVGQYLEHCGVDSRMRELIRWKLSI